jgi:hypothetical protein
MSLIKCPDEPYFIILLCLMPDKFTCQGESAATQWVNPLSGNAPRCTLLYYLLCLMPDDFTRQEESAATQ